MAEPTKNELVKEAEAAGVEDPSSMTKAELQAELEGQAPPELGPVVPEGQITPTPPKASAGSATEGVQPLEDADIPDAGR